MGTSAYEISIRELLQNRATGLTVAAILFIVAVSIAIYSLHPSNSQTNSYVSYYSDDDGQTYFKDSIYKLAPFDHDGKIANIAIVCTDGHKTFVGYLERFTPEARKQLQADLDANPTAPYKIIGLMGSPAMSFDGMELKLPGKDSPWISRAKMHAPDVQSPSGGDVQIVPP